MSKSVNELLNEFQTIDEIEDDFELFVMNIILDSDGEIESTHSVNPVSRIEVDIINQEYLFHSNEKEKSMSISDVIKKVSLSDSEHQLISAENNTIDNSTTTIDNPIIGFGENIEKRQFYVVCQAFENINVLH